MFVGLEDWKKRETPDLHAAAIAREWNRKFSALPEARIIAFGPPPLPGYGNVSGFTMQLQDRSGGIGRPAGGTVQQFLAEAAKRPELGRLSTTFKPGTPQVNVELTAKRRERWA